MRVTKYKTLKNGDGVSVTKEKAVNYHADSLRNANAIVECMNAVFDAKSETEEHVWLLCFDYRLNLKGIFEVSHGTQNISLCSPREIFMKALALNACSIVLVHNHPTGDASPSQQDCDVTEKVKQAGQVLDIKLLDHIVIGDWYFSYAENGRL